MCILFLYCEFTFDDIIKMLYKKLRALVKGGVSCSKGGGFESQCRILDGHFSHLYAVKIAMFV